MSNNGHFAIKSISGGNSSHSRSQKSLHPITLQDFGNNYVLVPVHTKDTTISKKQIKELTNIYQYKETKGNSFVLYNKQSPTTRIAVPYYYARNHITHGKSNIEIMNFYPQSTFYSTPPVGQFVAGNSARLTSVEDNILQSLIVFPELPGNEIYTGTYGNVSTKTMINSNSTSSVRSTNDINNSITSPSYSSVNSINNKSKINTTTAVNNRSLSNQYNNSYSNTYNLLHTNSKSQSRYMPSNTTSNYNTHSSGTSSMYNDTLRYKNDKKGTNMNYSLSNSMTSNGIQTNNSMNNTSDTNNCTNNTNNKLNLENNNTNDSTISVNNCTNSNTCLQKSHSSTILNSFNLSKSNSSNTFAYTTTTTKNSNSNNNNNENNNSSNVNHTMNSNNMNMNSLNSYNYTLKNKRSTSVASSSACTWTTLTTTTASPLPTQITSTNSDTTNTNKGTHLNVSTSPLSAVAPTTTSTTTATTTTTTTTQAFECNHLPKRYKSEREAYSNITNPTTFKECRTLLKSIFECIQKTGSIRVENITSLFPKNIQQIDKLLNILYNLRILVFMKDVKNVNDKGIYMINSKEIPISSIDISTLSKDLLSLQEENRKAEERIVILKQALEDPQSNPMTLYSSIVEKYPSQYLSEPLYSILNKLLNDNSENMS